MSIGLQSKRLAPVAAKARAAADKIRPRGIRCGPEPRYPGTTGMSARQHGDLGTSQRSELKRPLAAERPVPASPASRPVGCS
jgi:hypothetical protein